MLFFSSLLILFFLSAAQSTTLYLKIYFFREVKIKLWQKCSRTMTLTFNYKHILHHSLVNVWRIYTKFLYKLASVLTIFTM